MLLDGRLAALLLLGDHARPEAAAAVQELQQQGLACAMMTGDSAAAASAVAAAMGIPAAATHSNLLPEDKLQLLQQYKRQYKAVAHVGDGINDAPALANADVGIAMGAAGSALAVEAADVALFSNDLSNVPFAVGLGRHVAWVVTSNIVFAVVVKVAVLGLAFAGHITLWMSVLADVGSALLVTLHGLTVLRYQASRVPDEQQRPGSERCVGKRQLEMLAASKAAACGDGPVESCSSAGACKDACSAAAGSCRDSCSSAGKGGACGSTCGAKGSAAGCGTKGTPACAGGSGAITACRDACSTQAGAADVGSTSGPAAGAAVGSPCKKACGNACAKSCRASKTDSCSSGRASTGCGSAQGCSAARRQGSSKACSSGACMPACSCSAGAAGTAAMSACGGKSACCDVESPCVAAREEACGGSSSCSSKACSG